jgi:sugar phosphate isomerase/epimerase
VGSFGIDSSNVTSTDLGIDTYSYHRLLGEPRGGELPASASWVGDLRRTTAQARELGCAVVSLQTCFLGPPQELDPRRLRETVGSPRILFAWGHPEGLAFGRAAREEVDELLTWIELSAALGGSPLRLVLGGPRLRGSEPFAAQLARTLPQLRRVAGHAAAFGVELAIENHGDLDSEQLLELVERAEAPGLGVCFDTANAARVGEDVVAAAARLAPLVRMVHLKDVESPACARDRLIGPACVPLGTGTIPVDAVLAALAAPIAAGAPVCVEISQLRPGDDEQELVAQAVRRLRAVADARAQAPT